METSPRRLVRQESELEAAFRLAIRAWGDGLPAPIQEYEFHLERKWRVDFAWPDQKVAVEIEGGVYSGGRHNSVRGFLGDIEKYNALAEDGWRILRFANPHVEEQPFDMIEQIRRTLFPSP
jgi:very-short-patch-repair endonuclease